MNIDFLLGLTASLAALAIWTLTGSGGGERRLAGVLPTRNRTPDGYGRRWFRRGAAEFRRLRQGGREERLGRARVIEVTFALAAELRAGRTPLQALSRAAETYAGPAAELAGVLTAGRTGGDVPAALRAASAGPGAGGLRRLAACWHIGAGSGAGFADAVERVAETLRTEEQHREEVAAQLAGPRSTTRLLSALPLVGLVMATAMGLHPLGFLFGSAYGYVCLVAGCSLDAVGVVWTRRLARAEVG